MKIKLKEEDILLGMAELENLSRKRVEEINHIILIGKMVISKFKYGVKRNIQYMFENEISVRKIDI